MKDHAKTAKTNALSRNYAEALAAHLKSGLNLNLREAASLGLRAVSLGLETLDLGRIHERSLAAVILNFNGSRQKLEKRAQCFFIEANHQIELTHAAAANAEFEWKKINQRLKKWTSKLAVSQRKVRNKIVQRKAAEQNLKSRNKHFAKLLKESRSMQESLRGVAHSILAAQEDEKGQISRELHNEIAQTLLGINVRLLALQKQSLEDEGNLSKRIAGTRSLLDKSALSMRRAARKLRGRDEK